MLTNNNLHIVRIGYKNENRRETSSKKEDKCLNKITYSQFICNVR